MSDDWTEIVKVVRHTGKDRYHVSITYWCRECGVFVVKVAKNDRYCRGCGRRLNWHKVVDYVG